MTKVVAMLTMARLAVAMIIILALLAACSGAVQPRADRGDGADDEQTSPVQTDSSAK
jgi:ABC-type glycerol-3-phosphate transport system substrate-binding protein